MVTPSPVGFTKVPWKIIEDNDPRWIYKGFETHDKNWNASGSYLTFGYSNCSAELTFSGTAVQYYAYRSPKGGMVTVEVDGIPYGPFSQKDTSSVHGQHYIKIFELRDLAKGSHTIKILGDDKGTEKTIDMLSVIE